MRRLERLLAEFAALSAPKANIRPMRLRLSLAGRSSGDLVLRSYDLQVGYQDEGRPLFHAQNLVLKRGEWWSYHWPKRRGLKPPPENYPQPDSPFTRGGLKLGASLKVGYFAQGARRPEPRN
jgi:ATP-binding cassette subfamily F protein 3